MAPPLKTPAFSGEDYQEAPSWFERFTKTLSPYLSDVTGALNGNIDKQNLKRTIKTSALNTAASLEATFASNKVQIKSGIGRPTEVRAVISPKTQPTYAQETWTPFALKNTWVAYGGAEAVPAYRLYANGRVALRGLVKNGVIGSALGTLPTGFRPAATARFAVDSNGAFGTIAVNSDGSVVPTLGNITYFSLEGITFEATGWTGIGPFGPPIWTYSSTGMVVIKYIAGLSPNTTYDVTWVLE